MNKQQINHSNIILASDTYKFAGHFQQYNEKVTDVFSYLESRKGAVFPNTVFFGLQYYLKILEEFKVTQEQIDVAAAIASIHLGKPESECFNREGWEDILHNHGGKLPVHIRAVKEGTEVPVGHVMLTMQATDPKHKWLVGYLETLLMRVWYPCTVATLSRDIVQNCKAELEATCDNPDVLSTYWRFMLHDFGSRSTTGCEASALGGLAHLLNSWGSDTIESYVAGVECYNADINTLCFSVPASEHSVACSYDGELKEEEYLKRMLDLYPTGIVSIVADTYDIVNFIENIVPKFKDRILARDGRVVFRPDSPRNNHDTPELQVWWAYKTLEKIFGSTKNTKGFKVLNPKVGVIYGDGLKRHDIASVLRCLRVNGYSVENYVSGMGGGLLQSAVNRDTQRFAFKASAIKIGNRWIGIRKTPLDISKASKKGRLTLIKVNGVFKTVDIDNHVIPDDAEEMLEDVFKDGKILRFQTFEEIRSLLDSQ